MKIIYDGGQPHELIIDEKDLERIVKRFKDGRDWRESVIKEMKSQFQGKPKVNIDKVWIYFDSTNA